MKNSEKPNWCEFNIVPFSLFFSTDDDIISANSGLMGFNPVVYVAGLVMEAPLYHLILEGLLIIWIFQLLFLKSYYIRKRPGLSAKEEEELIAEWTPEPLVPPIDTSQSQPEPQNIVEGPATRTITINGDERLNLATTSFHGMNGHEDCIQTALSAIDKYGVGACGPRAFYGTIDIHLDFEKRIAEYLGAEIAILYSYGFSTISSAINCYCKRMDVVFCDEGSNLAIQKGIEASRSKVHYFKHNDMEHLRSLLEEHSRWEKRNSRQAKVTKKFLIVEGLYNYYGDICPLKELIEFKYQYGARLLVDESYSFGVLGATGKGAAEYYGLDNSDIDVVTVAMDHALGSNGGFAYGTAYMIELQRLGGLGYCFSAALPPYLTAAALKALDLIEQQPEFLSRLKENANFLYDELWKVDGVKLSNHRDSPVFHLRLIAPTDWDRDHALLKRAADKMNSNGVAVTMATYVRGEEKNLPEPSLRLVVNSCLTREDLSQVSAVLTEAIGEMVGDK